MRKNILIIALFGLAVPAIGTSEDKIDFAKQIYPFVKSGCVKCHAPPYEDERGRTRKPKAEIILATKEGIMESVDEEGNKILVPGKPDETRMLEVTKLPIDDDYHFPPEGKAPQWTDAEKELFGKWVAAGADFGDWEADPKPQEGLEWDGKEKEAGTVETAE
ncbi:MAG: hypothetical protein P1U87_20355 [Verrucomicrobiales bacterium]|nr:hypothetical protein [Verrucomicrobiales bacterium]